MGPSPAIWSYSLWWELACIQCVHTDRSFSLEILCSRDRMKFWFKSLGFTCFCWGKHFCLSFICSIKYLAHVWTAWNDKWINEYVTIIHLTLWSSQFSLIWRIHQWKNRITNTMCTFRRKNICSNPCVSVFHKSDRVRFRFNTNKKKIDLDWNGFALK